MTAAQIVVLGEYLDPEFEPTTLTVSQLLGILGYHNVPYPTPYTKAKLVNVFNNEVKTRAAKFKKERSKIANSVASEDGITDGHTGKPLSKTSKVSTYKIPRTYPNSYIGTRIGGSPYFEAPFTRPRRRGFTASTNATSPGASESGFSYKLFLISILC